MHIIRSKHVGLSCTSLLAALLVTPSAFGISLRDDVALASYETQVNTSPFNASGQFDTNNSGTLIDPYWVLASAHGGTANTFTATDGTTVNVAQRIVFPGDTSSSTAVDGNDFALFRLDAPINSVAPAALHDPGATGVSYSDLLGQIAGLTAVYGGSGETSTGDVGAAFGVTGTRDLLAGTNRIDTVGANVNLSGNITFVSNLVISDFDDPDTHDAVNNPVTALESGIMNRDSGGGLWVDLGNGQGHVLIGVHSSVFDLTPDTVQGDYGQLNASTALTDEAYTWISTTVPEPSSLALLAASGLMMIRRRR